ncbi:MAG: TetR family transcriptional regulator [Alphaproteobacteria bacterium]|nr:TetR family transcriptional regulator [Alphaproteobacteria bacterium]
MPQVPLPPQNSRDHIIAAAIRMIARHGLGNVSYRRIAQEAGVSLALVNYHFPAKTDLIARTSQTILAQYANSFEKAVLRLESETGTTVADFALRFLTNAIGRDRDLTIAWAEIVMDAPRHEGSLALALQWHNKEHEIWTKIAKLTGAQQPRASAELMIDLLTGLLFVALGTGIPANATDQLFKAGYRAIAEDQALTPPVATQLPAGSQKATETKRIILQAAVDIFLQSGAAGISFRAISERTGLSLSAPAYHFKSIDTILEASLALMIAQSKNRYRDAYREGDFHDVDFDQVTDLTNTIFIREAVSFADENIAFFSSWIQATRIPALQRSISAFVLDQERAWTRALTSPAQPRQDASKGLLALALYVGKFVRIVSIGSKTSDLAAVRGEFHHQFLILSRGDIG